MICNKVISKYTSRGWSFALRKKFESWKNYVSTNTIIELADLVLTKTWNCEKYEIFTTLKHFAYDRLRIKKFWNTNRGGILTTKFTFGKIRKINQNTFFGDHNKTLATMIFMAEWFNLTLKFLDVQVSVKNGIIETDHSVNPTD